MLFNLFTIRKKMCRNKILRKAELPFVTLNSSFVQNRPHRAIQARTNTADSCITDIIPPYDLPELPTYAPAIAERSENIKLGCFEPVRIHSSQYISFTSGLVSEPVKRLLFPILVHQTSIGYCSSIIVHLIPGSITILFFSQPRRLTAGAIAIRVLEYGLLSKLCDL